MTKNMSFTYYTKIEALQQPVPMLTCFPFSLLFPGSAEVVSEMLKSLVISYFISFPYNGSGGAGDATDILLSP